LTSTLKFMFSGLSPFYTIGARILCTEYKTQAHSHVWLSPTRRAHDSMSFEAIARAAQKQRVELTIHRWKRFILESRCIRNYATERNAKEVNNKRVTIAMSYHTFY